MVFLVPIITTVFLDLIFLPAFIGFQNSSLLSLFLISIIFYLGINKRSILIGIFLSVFIEIIFKYNPGLYTISFLIMVAMIFCVSKFFNFPTIRSSNNIFTTIGLSVAVLFTNYAFYLVFMVVSDYIKNDYRNMVPMHSLLTPALVGYYLFETLLIFYFIKLFTQDGKRI